MNSSSTDPHVDVNRRQDFTLLFDVTDGNPNGDPDAGDLPRVDPETMQGIVTDVSIKRKVRDYVDETHGKEERYKIYIQNQVALNDLHERAWDEQDLKGKTRENIELARSWMCRNFYDIRTFGAVMDTGQKLAGQVKGPIQLTFGRSIDRVTIWDNTISRKAITRREDLIKVSTEGEDEAGKSSTFGRKASIPYGLFRVHGYFVPAFAERTEFTSDDLELFWEALEHMWIFNRSASRGLTGCRGLYVFSHDSKLGNAPAHKLFERITVERNPEVVAPRAFSDYTVVIDEAGMPDGVTLTRLGE